MNRNILNIGFLVIAMQLAISCKEKDLTVNNVVPPTENVSLGASMLYGDVVLQKDSLYTNAQGNQFFIESIRLLVANFQFVEGTDTITTPGNYHIYSLGKRENLIYQLEPRGYAGKYGISTGLDSMSTEYANANNLNQEAPLNELDIMRNDIYGYNYLVISGRAIDPSDPEDSTGTQPFNYQIGTYMLAKDFESLPINFAVNKDKTANLVMLVDFKPVLDVVDIINTPFVVSDTTNLVDFTLAKAMANELEIGLF